MSPLFFSGLRTRLILLVLLGAIPLIILLIYSGLELRNHAADEVRRDTTYLVLMAAAEQQRLVKQTRQLLSMLAQVPQVKDGDAASCNSFMGTLLAETGSYANFGVIELDGDISCSAIPMKERVNASDRSYFQRTLKSREFSIGDYQVGRITNSAVLVFSYPVFNNNKQLKAVLFTSLPLSWIKKQSDEFELPQGSVVNVIDHTTHTLLAQYPASAVKIGSSVKNTLLVKAMDVLGGKGTAEITGLDGVKRLHSFTTLKDFPSGKEIYISFGVPLKLIYAEANAIMARNLVIFLLVIGMVLLLAWYGSHAMILRQLMELLIITRRLASGNLGARVNVSDSSNEISELGREFNQMAISLEQRDSEAIRAENMLRKSEEDLRRVVEAVPDIIYTASAANNFTATFVSPALTRILGFAPEEFVADPEQWSASIHDEDRKQVIKQRQSALDNSGGDLCIEYRMWHKDGQAFRWFEDRAHIDKDIEGHTTAIYGVMTDITERKLAVILSSRLGRILEDSWSEVYVFEANNLHFVDVSNGACRNLGYSMDELKEITPVDLNPGFTPGQFEALLGPLQRGEESQVIFETEHQRKDGSHYPVEIHLQFSATETPPVFIAITQDISERKQYISNLEHKALHDTLTGLPNRSLFQDRLIYALKAARRGASALAVLTIDVMRLREVNDILGHGAGDFVLQEVASRLQKTLRESDTLARLGGDEYAIILPGVSMQQVDIAVGKIQQQFELPVNIEDISLEVEAAIGIALYPEHGDEPALLLQHADIAMHVAKNESTGFSVYNHEGNPYTLRRLKLLGELRQAIEKMELVLYYQPQIDLKTGRITSVEALARWPHPSEGIIPPDEFIPMVEKSGLIQPFTHWVLEDAIRQVKRWTEAGIDLTIAVNLSARNLIDVNLPGDIEKLLDSYNVSPAQLTLEVTESAIMSRPETALSILTQLHNIGFKLSIDDFGTGYSSLAYLKKLPVSELKIDQSFVFGLTTNDDDAVIVRSTIELAQNMGLKVVAEGVEDQDILDTLVVLGCDIAQGYHMSRPLPVEELDVWLANSPWGFEDSS